MRGGERLTVGLLRPLACSHGVLVCCREAPSYLQFIVENYDRLPAVMAFGHGQECSWHVHVRDTIVAVVTPVR